jgi:hypothetical protein
MLTLSTPALPLLRLTAAKAWCINFKLILPVNEWCLIFKGSTIVHVPNFFPFVDLPKTAGRRAVESVS